MNCWNCQNGLDEVLLCRRCGMPQMVEVSQPFRVLGVPPRLGWSIVDLQLRYENLIQHCHPDLFRAHKDERVLSAARAAVQALNDAYRMLSTPVGRLRYVLAANNRPDTITRTIPEGLQSSAQIINRVLGTVEKAQKEGDLEAWEAEQDHIASLQVQVEATEERSAEVLSGLLAEWDSGVTRAKDEWPDMPDDWFAQVVDWIGKQDYLNSLKTRLRRGRQEPELSVTQ